MTGESKIVGYHAASGYYYLGTLTDKTGTYNTVGNVVNGTGTLFTKEFVLKDWLVDVTNKEQRQIINIISDTLIELSSPFTADRTGIAAKKGSALYISFQLVSTGAGTTINGILIHQNDVMRYDSLGFGIQPCFVIHTNPVFISGLAR
jgi:hypothetical protein